VQSPCCVLTRRSKNVVSWAHCSAGPATGAPCPSSPRRRYRRRRRRRPEAAIPALGGHSSSRTPAVHRVTKTQIRHRSGRLRVSLVDRTLPSTVAALRGSARLHARASILRERCLCQKHCTCRIRTRDRDISPCSSRRDADELIIGIIRGGNASGHDLRSRKSARDTLRNRCGALRSLALTRDRRQSHRMCEWLNDRRSDYLMKRRAVSKVLANKQNSPFIGIHQAASQIFLRKRSFCCRRDVRANLDVFIQSNHACKLENSPGQECSRELSAVACRCVLLITWFSAI